LKKKLRKQFGDCTSSGEYVDLIFKMKPQTDLKVNAVVTASHIHGEFDNSSRPSRTTTSTQPWEHQSPGTRSGNSWIKDAEIFPKNYFLNPQLGWGMTPGAHWA
jgi:hypothetical protein